MISVIIPAYNATKTIGACLKSVFAQSYKDIEVIIVNDGSTDDLNSALLCVTGKFVVYEQDNQGAPAARNFGFKQSHGESVIFLDADIIMNPKMLEKLHLALKADPEAAFAYSSFYWGWKKFKLWLFSYEKLKEMPYIHTSALIRREVFPGFDIGIKKFQDWDLFLTIAENDGKGVFIAEPLFKVTAKGTMSSWLPSFVYRLPFLRFRAKDKYLEAKEIIRKKHRI
ncbi:MAG: putative glycosyltransferase EpsH [Parcubacteria group bacterium ADurb.Bin326]|nr:MAG: putative glycosyltransferase EpsH [Parcubacteria group bacterium ADurb.Bin326]